RVSSPDRLDQLVPVTSPLGWLALLALGLLLAAVAAWSVVGRIPERVRGEGLLLRGVRLAEVQATVAGRLEELRVRPEGRVQPGDVIAVIRQDRKDLEEGLRLQQAEYERRRSQNEAQDLED